MSPEEFERLKEAEKAHLRKLKELKEAVRAHQRTGRVAGALGSMAEGRRTSLEGTDDAVERLAYETARAEARLEIALDARRADADAGASDEELEQARARDLIRRMKDELARDEQPPPAAARPSDASPSPTGERSGAERARAEQPGAAAPDEGLPEKTIGRMRRD